MSEFVEMANPTVAFTNKLHSKLGKPTENSFYSPFSIQVALGMVTAGAEEETNDCLCKALGCPKDKNEQKKFFKELVKEGSVPKDSPYELTTANALWAANDLTYSPKFKKNIVDNYDGVFEQVDYEKNLNGAIAQINSWCDKNTNGKIPEIVNNAVLDSKTRLVLTNAIYFKGKWCVEFDKKRTIDEDFTNQLGTKKVPTMRRTAEFASYYQGENFQALDLPYKTAPGLDSLSMMILLPKDLDALEDNLDSAYWEAVTRLGQHENVNISLPKFKLRTEYSLRSHLEEMGAALAFSDDANFSGITNKEALKISAVIHKAFVECDEEGTEAAAATAVRMIRCTSFQVKKVVEFKADHPFIFFIRNTKTNSILFCGKVVNP